jgi:hypothetical protein
MSEKHLGKYSYRVYSFSLGLRMMMAWSRDAGNLRQMCSRYGAWAGSIPLLL